VSAKGSFMACLVIKFCRSNEFAVFQPIWLPYIGVFLEKIGHKWRGHKLQSALLLDKLVYRLLFFTTAGK